MRGGGLSVYTLPREDAIEELVRKLGAEVRTPAGDVEPAAAELGRVLLEDAWGELKQAKQLVVVPTGRSMPCPSAS